MANIFLISKNTSIYDNSDNNYILTHYFASKGLKVVSFYKDYNNYRQIEFIDNNGKYVYGWVKEEDVIPLNK